MGSFRISLPGFEDLAIACIQTVDQRKAFRKVWRKEIAIATQRTTEIFYLIDPDGIDETSDISDSQIVQNIVVYYSIKIDHPAAGEITEIAGVEPALRHHFGHFLLV